MAKITIKQIQELRKRTGTGMMDCRKALEEAEGNIEKAIEILRKKGAALSIKRAAKETAEGIVEAYIHPGNRVGVLIEVDCETDFVAQTDEFKQFARDLCMHIAALKPLYLSPENVDQKFLEHEKDIIREQLADSGKPKKIIDRIVEGKIKSLYSEICLLEQSFVKNDQITVADLLKEMIAKLGENIKIKRFARFEIGS
ncbi:translation elongation factor Ts [Candidatus Dependentiae bacterium]|nr:MAG: translation elongation factor Ts [Candidatus Dependentiae bacterium]